MKTLVRIILVLMAFALAMACSELFGQKPKAVNDTFTNEAVMPVKIGDVWYHAPRRQMNVLINDSDPNGDSMNVTMFNGHSFKGQDSVVVPTLGTFYLTDKGNFSFKLEPGFYGTIEFSYNVNDLKVGASKRAYILFRHTRWDE